MSRKIAETRHRFPRDGCSISGFFKPHVTAVLPLSYPDDKKKNHRMITPMKIRGKLCRKRSGGTDRIG
jgi:hypothetical protein